jgi:lipoprotein-releasing system permease protein
VILGIELANNLNVTVGQEVTLFTPIFRMTPVGMMPKVSKIRVAGIFKTDFYEYDAGMLYMSLADAQRLFDAPEVVTQIGVRVEELDTASSIARQIQAMDPGINFWAKDWLGMHHNLFTALATEKLIMFIILACMILVAAFNIISTLIMVVMEKQKEIGVLKSLGAPHKGIMKIFVYQGLVIGFFGTLAGFALGLLMCLFIQVYPIHIPGGGQVYYIEYLPVAVQGMDLAVILALSFVICFLATLYPAYKGSRLDPVEAIRYE